MNKDDKIMILQLEAICLWMALISSNEIAELVLKVAALVFASLALITRE